MSLQVTLDELAMARRRYLTRGERDTLRKQVRTTIQAMSREGNHEAAKRMTLELLWIGGVKSHELDLIGLTLLEVGCADRYAVHIARLVCRHVDDGIDSLPLNETQMHKIVMFLHPERPTITLARRLICQSPSAEKWLQSQVKQRQQTS